MTIEFSPYGLKINNDGREIVLQTIADQAPQIRAMINAHTRKKNNCIVTAAVMQKVLQFYQVNAAPLVVRAAAYNAEFWSLVERLGWPRDDITLNEWIDLGAYSVGLGYAERGQVNGSVNGSSWAGHLVLTAAIPDRWGIWLLDVSLDQATRPGKGIELVPLVGVVNPDPIRAGEIMATKMNDAILVYNFFPDERSYEGLEDWIEHKKNSKIARGVVEYINGALQPVMKLPYVDARITAGGLLSLTCPHCKTTHMHKFNPFGAEKPLLSALCGRGRYFAQIGGSPS